MLRHISILLILFITTSCDNVNNNIQVVNNQSKLIDQSKNDTIKVIQDTAFHFEKIVFHTTGCEGTCPTFHLIVEKDKRIQLHSEVVYKNESSKLDKSKIGYFKGSVTDTTFKKLLFELKTLGLDTLNFDGTIGYDAPIKTIIVYYNGKRKYLKTMFQPKKAIKLILILYEICEASKVKKANFPFEIENASR
jgi:hypothetical protein